MKKISVNVMFDEEKLAAAKMYMAQRELDVRTELEKALDGMYAKYVPSNVREFIDMKSDQKPVKPKTDRSQQKRNEVTDTGE